MCIYFKDSLASTREILGQQHAAAYQVTKPLRVFYEHMDRYQWDRRHPAFLHWKIPCHQKQNNKNTKQTNKWTTTTIKYESQDRYSFCWRVLLHASGEMPQQEGSVLNCASREPTFSSSTGGAAHSQLYCQLLASSASGFQRHPHSWAHTHTQTHIWTHNRKHTHIDQ